MDAHGGPAEGLGILELVGVVREALVVVVDEGIGVGDAARGAAWMKSRTSWCFAMRARNSWMAVRPEFPALAPRVRTGLG